MKVLQNLLYKKPTREDENRAGHRRKIRGEAALSNTHSEMCESTGKHRKRYVDYPKDISKRTCIIHGYVNSLDEYKVLGDFGSKYYKSRRTKDHGQETTNMNKLNRNQQNNAMVHNTFDDIILQDNNKLSAEDEAHKNIDSEAYEDDLYEIDNMSLDENKEEK